MQSGLVQRFFDAQAQVVAGTILQRQSAVRFMLPDQIIAAPAASPKTAAGQTTAAAQTAILPADQREHKVGGLTLGTHGPDLGDKVRQRLTELEQSTDPAVAVSAGLLRYAIARHMVSGMLPAGRTVSYVAVEGEETPSLPDPRQPEVGSALTQATDAVAEEPAVAGEEPSGSESRRGELHVPYVPYARRFYLPQWVAFDVDDRLLTHSLAEAEAHIGSMQRFVSVLHAAVAMAAYFVADDTYQQKRYGMLGQLVNQGRALARFQTHQIIHTIQRRALAHELNRGLSLSLPYFDDQALKLKIYPFVVIPAGRIMFVPTFVVRAAREEACRVAQDTRLGASTRKYLLAELALLEQAFATPNRVRTPEPVRATLSLS
jgi:hypothetical protein